MPRRDVDPAVAALLTVVTTTAEVMGETPGLLLRRLVSGLLAEGGGRASTPDLQPEAWHPSQDATRPLPVALVCGHHLVQGLYVPTTRRLVVLSGTDVLDGMAYTSPTSAARAVISVLDPQASPTQEFDGFRLWHTTADGRPLAGAERRYREQKLAGAHGRVGAARPRVPSPSGVADRLEEVRVSMCYDGQFAWGRFVPGTGRLTIDTGPAAVAGKSFGSPSAASSAVVAAVRGPERGKPARNGWEDWVDGTGMALCDRFAERGPWGRRV